MEHELNIWVIGGDLRQVKLAELLVADGHTVHTYALEQVSEPDLVAAESTLKEARRAHCAVLPLPVEGREGMLNAPLSSQEHTLSGIMDAFRPGQVICAGMATPETAGMAAERGLTFHDYFLREELAVANAIPTAEGALQIAMEELAITLHGARVLVIGYGRLGRLLADRFSALGARVTVSARKYSDMAWAEAYGYAAERTDRLDGWMCSYDLVVNTVPFRVLDEARLADLMPGALVIDLASRPGGVDFEAASRLGVKAIWALSLPGKVAPVTSGKNIRDTIYNILQELEV